MNRRITPFLFLLLSLLCFAAAAALHFNTLLAGKYSLNQPNEVTVVQERVHHCIEKANIDARLLASQLGGNSVSFSKLLGKSAYPALVYKQNQLVFWSDHTVITDLDQLPVIERPTVIGNEYGTFIIVPHTENGYKIFISIPLQTGYRIRNSYLTKELAEDVFEQEDAMIVLDPSVKLPKVETPDGRFLFAMEQPATKSTTETNNLQLLLLLTGVALYVIFAALYCRQKVKQGNYSKGILSLLVLLIILRAALLLFSLPFSITDVGLFDPQLYAASRLSPSIGDLILNMLLLVTVALAGLYLFRKRDVVAQLKKLPQKQRKIIVVFCMLAFYFLLAVLYKFYYGIYHNSPLILDISLSLEFTRYKIIMYGIMLLHTIALCAFTFMLTTVATVLLKSESKWWPYQVLLLITAVVVFALTAFQLQYWSIVLVGTFFWLTIILSAHQRHAVNFSYRSYLFLFLVLAVSALIGAFALYAHYQNESRVYKQAFAANITQGNDVVGEYFLDEVAGKIGADALIRSKMMGPYVDASFIKRKITRQYLRDYFDKYETSVLLFDSQGRSLETADTAATTLKDLLAKYNTPQTRTERENLFLIKDPARYNHRTYLKLIEVPIGQVQNGTIALQLNLKELLPNSLLPELLENKSIHSDQLFRRDMLSYAIYDKGKLSYSEGEYDYATNLDVVHIGHEEFYRNGHNQGNHHHLGTLDENGNILIVTTEKYGGTEMLSNFSFLFLAFMLGMILLGLTYLLLQRKHLREFTPNFSTKIQIFLNFGILLPLLLVSIATAGLVTASYKKDLMTTYEQRGEAIQENLGVLASAGALLDSDQLQERVMEVATIAEADVNIYDKRGRLLTTSQPLIFEAGLLSKLINPHAFAAISERQALRVMREEKAGNLSFNAVYLPLRRTSNPDELLGFIGIPFFDSEKQLDLKLIELITTTMNIFTVMFLMFMVLTFFASRALTVPLRLLADKLKRTSLTGKNEMLGYEGADEIGLLVKEYNRMLLTLEQNKQDLAMQEKEAAWREMARQVAHEIKNPLTPMKLSLQYLQKAIAEKKPNTEQLIDKISHTLITQINILSDIATSFSSFTAMPEPKAELMDVAAALRKAANLHNDPAAAKLTMAIPGEAVMVMADESLMVRTFNNLLLNAIQAVPTSRKPYIRITLQTDTEQALISIQDNGSGIPQDIHHKVFVPNFSTKYTGSGIGLAVAKKGIENAGGRIWFETEEGKGTTFKISLPLATP